LIWSLQILLRIAHTLSHINHSKTEEIVLVRKLSNSNKEKVSSKKEVSYKKEEISLAEEFSASSFLIKILNSMLLIILSQILMKQPATKAPQHRLAKKTKMSKVYVRDNISDNEDVQDSKKTDYDMKSSASN